MTEPVSDDADPPEEVRREAERLTRHARSAPTDAEAEAAREERDRLLAEHGYTARVREADSTLVLHPDSWLDDTGTLQLDAVENVDRGVEITLEGAGDPDDWDAIDEHNAAIAARVREAHGDVHGDTAAAFAAFMSNHYAREIETAGERERREFCEEYFPRNAWPTAEQRERLDESLRLVFEVADGTQ